MELEDGINLSDSVVKVERRKDIDKSNNESSANIPQSNHFIKDLVIN